MFLFSSQVFGLLVGLLMHESREIYCRCGPRRIIFEHDHNPVLEITLNKLSHLLITYKSITRVGPCIISLGGGLQRLSAF